MNLVLVIFLLAVTLILSQCPHTEPGLLLWSSTATWGGTLPTAGATLTISNNTKILLDVSPPALRGIRIQPGGVLIVSPSTAITLTTEFLIVYGRFAAGSDSCPYTGLKFELILKTPLDMFESIDSFGTKVLGVGANGVLDLHGANIGPSWTVLTTTAKVGDKTIVLRDAPSWKIGDQIVLASTDFDPAQAETVTITAVSGTTVSFDIALKFSHYGGDPSLIDERGEVGLMTRNIVIRGDSDTNTFGGHIMGMHGATKFFMERVQVSNAGQKGILGRYPIHLHMMGEMAGKAFIYDNSVVNNFQRCIVIHTTNSTLVKNNMAYNTTGHCYFLEDACEQNNELSGNLGILTKKGSLIPTDNRPATYWITHPSNTIKNNVAAGSEQFGFWYALPKTAIGASANLYPGVIPWKSKMGEFTNNKAHSNGQDGLFIDEGPSVDGVASVNGYDPRVDRFDSKSESLQASFVDFTAYKNRNRGVWSRGGELKFLRLKCANNAICATHAAGAQGEAINEDALVIGETANLGNPRSWERKGLDDRSLPIPWEDDKDPTGTDTFAYPIRGLEFYDGPVTIKNPDIRNFVPNSQRNASCISYLRKNRFSLNPQNRAIGIKCDANSKKVYLFDTLGDGDRSASFYDSDGSVTGNANTIVIRKKPFLYDEGSCTCKDEWIACTCTPNHGQLIFQNLDMPSTTFFDGTMIEMVRSDRERRDNQIIEGQPFDNKERDNFATTILFGKEYFAQFNFSAPQKMRIYLNYADVGKSIRLGLCYPKEATDIVVTANYNQNKPLSLAPSLEMVTRTSYWRSPDGSIYVNMTQDRPRANWQTPGYYPVIDIVSKNPLKTITKCLPDNKGTSIYLGLMTMFVIVITFLTM